MSVLGMTFTPQRVRCGLRRAIHRHTEVALLGGLLPLLLLLVPPQATRFSTLAASVDWETIATLAGIILITTGIRRSRLFAHAALALAARVRTERALAVALTFMTAALATFLTNDIALLIMVPLTLSLQDLLDNEVLAMVIFEALAANVGSALTPIGNPQNLYLWHRWGLSFVGFVRAMAVPVGLMALLLAVFVMMAFRSRPLGVGVNQTCPLDGRLAAASLAALVVYVALAEMQLAVWAFPVLLLLYAFLEPAALSESNWALVVLFVLMFVDFHLLAAVPWVQHALQHLGGGSQRTVFWGALVASQAVSNVPAAILLSQFSHAWRALALGVNVGGNGLFIGSLANLIALKMADDRRIWWDFHKFSLLYLAATALVVVTLL